MLLIFNILWIINLGNIIAKINIIRTIILKIAITITILAISLKKENVIFVAKKVVTLTSI